MRFGWAALLTLLLAVRSLAPAGFMPSFDDGALTIVACPGASPMSMSHHGQPGDHQGKHQPCPYADASGLGALAPDWPPLLASVFFAVALLLGRTFLFIERHSRRERPPLRGPPVAA